MQAADGCFRLSMLDRLSTASPLIRETYARMKIVKRSVCRPRVGQYSARSVISVIALSCHAGFPES